MFTVRRGVNSHFFRFEELTPKIAWRVACDVGVGFLFWKGKKIRGTFKEEEKHRRIMTNQSWALLTGLCVSGGEIGRASSGSLSPRRKGYAAQIPRPGATYRCSLHAASRTRTQT